MSLVIFDRLDSVTVTGSPNIGLVQPFSCPTTRIRETRSMSGVTASKVRCAANEPGMMGNSSLKNVVQIDSAVIVR